MFSKIFPYKKARNKLQKILKSALKYFRLRPINIIADGECNTC